MKGTRPSGWLAHQMRRGRAFVELDRALRKGFIIDKKYHAWKYCLLRHKHDLTERFTLFVLAATARGVTQRKLPCSRT